MKQASTQISVLGDGGWGTALALLLYENGHRVRLWGAFPEYVEEIRKTRKNRKFLPGAEIPKPIELCADFPSVVKDCDLFVSVVPTTHLRSVMEKFSSHSPADATIVSATKGIEQKTLLRPSEIIRSVLGKKISLAVLAGPSHAEEVSRKLPASLVAASENAALAKRTQSLFNNDRFRVYAGQDPTGVELGSALKNIYAIAAGICDGLKMGDNAKAALITRALVEMSRYGSSKGAKRETFYGLAGVGDLLTTCYSQHSRNRGVGEKIARGQKLQEVLNSTEMVAEGVSTTKALCESSHNIDMPIAAELYKILFQDKEPRSALQDLMQRATKEEV